MPSIAQARVRPAPVSLHEQEHPTVERAIDRFAEAAQSLVADQIKVALLDLKVVGARMLQSAALLLACVLLLVGAWAALTVAAYVLLASTFLPEQRLGLIALANGLLGLGLMVAADRVMKASGDD